MKAESPLIRTIEIKDRNGKIVGSKEVVTYQGLLSKAHDEGLKAIRTTLVQTPSEENGRVAIAKAEIETEKGLFEGLGDASPANVNSFIVPHLIRMAETRAKARALRDAVNVGVVSFEELDGEALGEEVSAPGSGARRSTESDGREARATQRGSFPTRSASDNEPMTEAQRRYLFRLLAGKGYKGEAAENYLYEEFQVRSLQYVSRGQASKLIDQLVQTSAPQGGGGNGADHPQR